MSCLTGNKYFICADIAFGFGRDHVRSGAAFGSEVITGRAGKLNLQDSFLAVNGREHGVRRDGELRHFAVLSVILNAGTGPFLVSAEYEPYTYVFRDLALVKQLLHGEIGCSRRALVINDAAPRHYLASVFFLGKGEGKGV